jgi:hypothetical protein
MLKSLSQQGIESATLQCWHNRNAGKPTKQDIKRVYLAQDIKNQLQILYGATASWASELQEIVEDGITYRQNNATHLTGDAIIGFMASNREYHVGTIKKILKVNVLDKCRKEGFSEVDFFLVNRYRRMPQRFHSHLWENVLSHSALGTFIVDTKEEEKAELVPLARVIGHVAVRTLTDRHGSALLTLQLTKVFNLATKFGK